MVASFGQFPKAGMAMQITEMADRVCQGQRFAFLAAERDGLLIQRQRSILTPQVALDLSQAFERQHELPSGTGLAREGNRFH
jgi:hypothetical protein